MVLLGSVISWSMFLLGLALMLSILLRRHFRYYGRRGRSTTATRSPIPFGQPIRTGRRGRTGGASASGGAGRDSAELLPLVDAPPEILRWQVEMHETARDLRAELQSQAGVLNQLLLLAREEAARIEGLLDELERRESGARRQAS